MKFSHSEPPRGWPGTSSEEVGDSWAVGAGDHFVQAEGRQGEDGGVASERLDVAAAEGRAGIGRGWSCQPGAGHSGGWRGRDRGRGGGKFRGFWRSSGGSSAFWCSIVKHGDRRRPAKNTAQTSLGTQAGWDIGTLRPTRIRQKEKRVCLRAPFLRDP
jgi:hypothetical protein